MIRSMAFVTAATVALTPSTASAYELDAVAAANVDLAGGVDLVVMEIAASANDNSGAPPLAFEPAPASNLACDLRFDGADPGEGPLQTFWTLDPNTGAVDRSRR